MYKCCINESECERLYNMGMNDRQIAEAIKAPLTTVASWRHRTNRISISEKRRSIKALEAKTGIIADVREADRLGMTYGQYKASKRMC